MLLEIRIIICAECFCFHLHWVSVYRNHDPYILRFEYLPMRYEILMIENQKLIEYSAIKMALTSYSHLVKIFFPFK